MIKAYSHNLKRLHSIPIHCCPFDSRNDAKIIAATNRVQNNLVDESDFDEERRGWSAREVMEKVLCVVQQQTEDLVFCHGDYCLPNLILKPGYEFSGFIDLSRAGISDRYQDLALAWRSVRHNFGEGYDDLLFEEYGVEKDFKKIEFYCLLDELF